MEVIISIAGEITEQEDVIIRRVAANLLRNGIENVLMLTSEEQTLYRGGATEVATPFMSDYFRSNPALVAGAVIIAQGKKQ